MFLFLIDSTSQNSYFDSAAATPSSSLDQATPGGVQQSFLYPYHLAAVMASSQMALFQQRIQQHGASGSQLPHANSSSGELLEFGYVG